MDAINTNETSTPKGGPDAKALTFLIAIMFLNGLGFGIIAPVLPFILLRYISSPADLGAVAGWLTAAYAACQIIAAPGLGLLSDRYGRRPLLLICLVGSAIGYIVFGIGGSLTILFAGRIVDGLTGGNFSIAFAYVADTTAPADRPKIFGRIGAVNGVSFLIGPTIGGLVAKISLEAPVYLAAALTILAIVWGYFFLPESLKQPVRTTQIRLSELNPFAQIGNIGKVKSLRPILAVVVLYAFPFAVLGSNFNVLMVDSLHWDASAIGFISLLIGVIDIVVQGWLIGKLLPIFGTKNLITIGFVFQAVAYALFGLLAITPSLVLVIVGALIYAFSSGLVEPALSGLTSQAVGSEMQGLLGGANQSLQSLTRVVGPIWAGIVYTSLGHAIPYFVNISFMGLGLIVILTMISQPRQVPKVSTEMQAEKIA